MSPLSMAPSEIVLDLIEFGCCQSSRSGPMFKSVHIWAAVDAILWKGRHLTQVGPFTQFWQTSLPNAAHKGMQKHGAKKTPQRRRR